MTQIVATNIQAITEWVSSVSKSEISNESILLSHENRQSVPALLSFCQAISVAKAWASVVDVDTVRTAYKWNCIFICHPSIHGNVIVRRAKISVKHKFPRFSSSAIHISTEKRADVDVVAPASSSGSRVLWKWRWTNRMKLMHDEMNNDNNTTLWARDTRCGVAVAVPESGTWKSWSHSTSTEQNTYVIYTAVEYHVLHFVKVCCSDITRGTTQDNFYDKWSVELRFRGDHIEAVHVHLTGDEQWAASAEVSISPRVIMTSN